MAITSHRQHGATATAVGAARTDWSVQSLRGLAIVLMVAGHVVGGTAEQGMQVADGSWWRRSYLVLEDLRMPLFTVLSGYVYAYRPLRASADLPRLVRGKARRLLVPLLTVGTLLLLTQLVVPGANADARLQDLWRIPVFGYEHLWFVQAIFVIFVAVGALDAFGRLATFRQWLGALTVAAALFVLVTVPSAWAVFSVNGAIRLLPFFLLGYGLHRFAGRLERGAVLVPALVVFAAAFAVRIATILGGTDAVATADDSSPGTRLLSFAVGLTGVTLLFALRHHLRAWPLMWLGQFAFPVYLLHVFGSAGTRVALDRLGVTAEVPVFAVGLAAALLLPVVVTMTLGRDRLFSSLVLGQRPWQPVAVPRGQTAARG